jgi:hypothetical protein
LRRAVTHGDADLVPAEAGGLELVNGLLGTGPIRE